MMVVQSDERLRAVRFEELLDRLERLRAGGLAFDELREVGALYRTESVRLARMRERNDDAEAIRHLNALCVRAYTLLYGGSAARRAGRVPLAVTVADLLGRTWWAQSAAWLLLALGMLIGGVLAGRDIQALPVLIPAGMGYSADSVERLAVSSEARADFLAREAMPIEGRLAFGSYLFVHNTRVGLLSFATGVLAAIPTILLQLYNGLVLGAFFSIFLRDALPIDFLAWILPHGIPELTAICLCAAAGLILGAAVAAPGRGGRRAALRDAVAPALVLVGCSLPLFVIAAAIESLVRESALGTASRLAFAFAFLLGLLLFLRVSRRLARHRADTRWLAEVIAPPRSEAPGNG